jgi:hypothetical protein
MGRHGVREDLPDAESVVTKSRVPAYSAAALSELQIGIFNPEHCKTQLSLLQPKKISIASTGLRGRPEPGQI